MKGKNKGRTLGCLRLVVFVTASNEQNNGLITVNMWKVSEKGLEKHVWQVGGMGCSMASLEVFISFFRPWWATEGGAGEWDDQSLSSKSKERKADYQVNCKGEGNTFETARDFCLHAWKEKACACLNSTESKGLAGEQKQNIPRSEEHPERAGPNQSLQFHHFSSHSQVPVGGQQFSSRHFLCCWASFLFGIVLKACGLCNLRTLACDLIVFQGDFVGILPWPEFCFDYGAVHLSGSLGQ